MDTPKHIQQLLEQLPQQPGVYRFFDKDESLLYIGKATNLRSRVRSYFRESTDLSVAKQIMVRRIANIEHTVVDTEPEALLLETTLIKKYKPPYNVVMKDDKNFQYIHITDDEFPHIETVRKLSPSDTGKYFGPYVSGRALKRTLKLLKSIFHYCESPPEEKRGKLVYPKRACLDFHMGRCVGPCAKAISAHEYQQVIAHVADFLQGDYDPIVNRLRMQMENYSQNQAFEKAARLRDQIESVEHMMVEQKVVSTRRENADYISLARSENDAAVNVFVVRKGMVIHQEAFILEHTKDQHDEEIIHAFVDQYYAQTVTKPTTIYYSTENRRGKHRRMLLMGIENAQQALERYVQQKEQRDRKAKGALDEFREALGMHESPLHRIEVYDISNIQGKHTVASMVVFIDGLPAPQHYRKFTIRTVDGPNDFASMREVMDRRLQHLPGKSRGKDEESAWPEPDLIIIDGGKGQLSSAKSIVDALKLEIPIISLAKREEEIFFPDAKEPLLLERDSESLYLVQRMRDEAHRFAIGFYRRTHLNSLV